MCLSEFSGFVFVLLLWLDIRIMLLSVLVMFVEIVLILDWLISLVWMCVLGFVCFRLKMSCLRFLIE